MTTRTEPYRNQLNYRQREENRAVWERRRRQERRWKWKNRGN